MKQLYLDSEKYGAIIKLSTGEVVKDYKESKDNKVIPNTHSGKQIKQIVRDLKNSQYNGTIEVYKLTDFYSINKEVDYELELIHKYELVNKYKF